MKHSNPVLRHLCEYGMITLGCAIYALSFNWFFAPNNISMGGFTGVAQIINRFLPALPVGVTSIALNVPLFAVARLCASRGSGCSSPPSTPCPWARC